MSEGNEQGNLTVPGESSPEQTVSNAKDLSNQPSVHDENPAETTAQDSGEPQPPINKQSITSKTKEDLPNQPNAHGESSAQDSGEPQPPINKQSITSKTKEDLPNQPNTQDESSTETTGKDLGEAQPPINEQSITSKTKEDLPTQPNTHDESSAETTAKDSGEAQLPINKQSITSKAPLEEGEEEKIIGSVAEESEIPELSVANEQDLSEAAQPDGTDITEKQVQPAETTQRISEVKSDSKILQSDPTTTFALLLEDRADEARSDSIEVEELIEQDTFNDEFLDDKKKKVTLTRRKSKRKEVTIGEGIQMIDADKVEVEEEEEYVWVEEEVDEEVEVETDEVETIEDETVEEETDEYEEKEMSEEMYKEIEGEELETEASEEIDEEGEEKEARKEFIEEELQLEEMPPAVEDEEQEMEDEIEEEIAKVPLEEIEEEKIKEEYGEEIGEEVLGEELEEEIEEEELGEMTVKKKKRKVFRTIKVIKMVRKKKADVIKKLKEQAEPVDDDIMSLSQEEIELNKQAEAEAARKEREKTIELMIMLANQVIAQKQKNKQLSKSIIDYYKQKKIDSAYQIETPSPDLINKYFKRLNLLQDVKQTATVEKTRMLGEIDTMKDELDKLTKEYEIEKAELLAWETEVGRSAITAHTGRPLEESIIKHIVQRHDVILNQLSEERLKLITLQHQMLTKEAEIKQLVTLEGNLSLIGYEQLLMDNQIFADKLEERETELSNLRQKVREIIQTHSLVLEKSDGIVDDIENFNVENHRLEREVTVLRERVSKMKKTRDVLRGNAISMRKNAGLLIRPKLAIDYEEVMYRIENLKNEVDNLMKTSNNQKVIIDKLKKQIADATSFNYF